MKTVKRNTNPFHIDALDPIGRDASEILKGGPGSGRHPEGQQPEAKPVKPVEVPWGYVGAMKVLKGDNETWTRSVSGVLDDVVHAITEVPHPAPNPRDIIAAHRAVSERLNKAAKHFGVGSKEEMMLRDASWRNNDAENLYRGHRDIYNGKALAATLAAQKATDAAFKAISSVCATGEEPKQDNPADDDNGKPNPNFPDNPECNTTVSESGDYRTYEPVGPTDGALSQVTVDRETGDVSCTFEPDWETTVGYGYGPNAEEWQVGAKGELEITPDDVLQAVDGARHQPPGNTELEFGPERESGSDVKLSDPIFRNRVQVGTYADAVKALFTEAASKNYLSEAMTEQIVNWDDY